MCSHYATYFVTQRVKLDYFGCGYWHVSSCDLEIMVSNGGLGQEQYTRLLLLTRRRDGIGKSNQQPFLYAALAAI